MPATTGRHRLPRRRPRRAWITALIVFVLVGGVAAAADASRPGSGRAPTLVGLYTGHERPSHPSAPDPKAVELGVQFTVSRPGSVVAIRYYKSRLNRGQQTGTLWTASGVELATVVFTNEHRSGWQVATFAKPVQVTPGVTYVASYHTNSGHYASQQSVFAGGQTIGNSIMRGVRGVFRYGPSGFPTSSWHDQAYFVDALFAPAQPSTGSPTPSASPSAAPSSTPPTHTISAAPSKPATSKPTMPKPVTSAPAPPPTTASTTAPASPPPTSTAPGPVPASCSNNGPYVWANLAACGWPASSNTGPVLSACPGNTLTVNSGAASRTVRITTANTVISCQNITGCLSIEAPNVTVQNVKIACTSGRTGESANGTGVIFVDDGASVTVNDAELNGMDGVHACIWHQGTAMSANAVNCYGMDDGIFSWADTGYSQTTGDHFSITNSYFHDFTSKTSNGHIDGYQTEGAGNGVISHNTYLMTSDNNNGTDSAIAIWNSRKNSHDITVSDNLIAGGGFAIYSEDYSPSESSPAGGFTVTNTHFNSNVFSTHLFGCVGYFGVWFPRGGAPSDGWHRSGNRVLETGADVDNQNPTSQGRSCT